MTIMPREPSKLTAVGVALILLVVAIYTVFAIVPVIQASIDMAVSNPAPPGGWELVKGMFVVGIIMLIITMLPQSFTGR
jgi:hypothetical protein